MSQLPENKLLKTVLLFFILFICGSKTTNAQTKWLVDNFRNPPKEYSLLPFWSLNGTLEPEKLKWQIDQMMEKGVYGAFLHARAGLDEGKTPYFSEEFWQAMDTIINYSAKRGFQACLYDEDKWPSGSAGGRTIAANPEEFVKKALSCLKMEVIGPQKITINLHENPLAVFAGRISETGNYNFQSQQNLTESAGRVWEVPPGRWAITSFKMVKDPAKQIDYLDSLAVAQFIKITHEEYFKRYGQHFGKTIPGIFFDEIFANFSKMDLNIFWTDDFLTKFRKIKGYDLANYLPLILLNDNLFSNNARFDYFDVVSNLYVNSWFRQYADWCEKHRIWATGHTAELFVHFKRQADYFSTMGQLQVPGADNEEYRYGFPRMIDWYNFKQISSIANLYERKRVMAETMGGGGYTITLDEYRYGLSMLGVYGINMFIPHLFHYTTSTPESQADWPPSWFYQNPYWKYFKQLADFGSRISFMNSQGKEVCVVAILYPLTDLWAKGYLADLDDSYYRDVQKILIDNHINYNIIDPVSLVNAKTENKRIKAGFGNYQILILPAVKNIRSEVLKKIEHFVENGGTVIALKELPSDTEKNDEADWLNGVVNKIWGFTSNTLGAKEYYQWNSQKTDHFTLKTSENNGKAYFSRFMDELPGIIDKNTEPDIRVEGESARFLKISHRSTENGEIYLVVNDRNLPGNFRVTLKNKGFPSMWNIETGEIQEITQFKQIGNRLVLNLPFHPFESYFVVVDTTDIREPVRISKSAGSDPVFKNDTLLLDGKWQFQVVPKNLNYTWSDHPKPDTLEIPVMKFKPETPDNKGIKQKWHTPDFDDSHWKTVKTEDLYSQKKGICRYFSHWDAAWITWYDHSKHIPDIQGGTRFFEKKFTINGEIKEAKLWLTAEQSYTLIINNQAIGNDNNWETIEYFDIAKHLMQGLNTLHINVENTKGLLVQGYIQLKNGKKILLNSDETWLSSTGGSNWQPAFRFADPPLGHWGNLPFPAVKTTFPVTVWYRQKLPPGTHSILKPDVKGKFELYINGKKLNIKNQITDIQKFINDQSDVISLRILADNEEAGLIKPLRFVCGNSKQPLVSWQNSGLSWYSGRVLYSRFFTLSEEKKTFRLMLDPGKVNYMAEIWVNGQNVRNCAWPPFTTEITQFVKPGENEIRILVSNLLANRATWNILDANIENREARWWHNGTLMRESEMLESGLMGPVKIIFIQKTEN